MEGAPSKQCRKCGETKPISQFSVEKRNRDGIASWCKHCIVLRARQSYIDHYVQKPGRPRVSHEERLRRQREYSKRPDVVENRRQKMRQRMLSEPDYAEALRERYRVNARARAAERRKGRIGSIMMYLTHEEVEQIKSQRMAKLVEENRIAGEQALRKMPPPHGEYDYDPLMLAPEVARVLAEDAHQKE